MKWITLILVCIALFAGCSGPSSKPHDVPDGQAAQSHHDHGGTGTGDHAAKLVVQTQPVEPQAGQNVALDMMVHDAAGKIVSSFDVTHEKKAHLIIVREGLDQFGHMHPDVDQEGRLAAKFEFPVGGKYYLILDHKPTGEEQAVARAEIRIAGDSPKAASLSPNSPGTITADNTVATITIGNLKPGEEATIKFQLSDPAGKPVIDLEPYLGAMGHLVVISADAGEYVHAHPQDVKASPSEVKFMMHFAKPGLYKGWGQFRRAGTVRIVPFVIAVKSPQEK